MIESIAKSSPFRRNGDVVQMSIDSIQLQFCNLNIRSTRNQWIFEGKWMEIEKVSDWQWEK